MGVTKLVIVMARLPRKVECRDTHEILNPGESRTTYKPLSFEVYWPRELEGRDI
jgi:hypothetical protein